jgi:uncharacterized membrane protein
MNNILVAIFNDDKTAIEAMHKVYQLDRQEDIEVFNHVLLKRNLDGTFEYLKDERDPDGWGTLTGMVLGSFLGIVGGPVGLLAGFFGGMAVGAVTDAFRYGFDYDFMENFKQGIPPGTTALIAEVTEPSKAFINEAFAPYNVVIWRSNVYTEQDKYFQAQVDALDADIDKANAELEQAVAEDKAAIQAKVNELKARRDAKVAEIKADIQDDVDSLKASVANLKAKIQGKVDEARRHRLEAKLKRDEELIAKFEGQADKLNAELAKYKTATHA